MRKTIYTLAALALSVALPAQNINQTVQVTNDYAARFADFQKQGGEMKVPDSLYRFDYRFDYSVFETPYNGSYEFSPYRIQVTPQARSYDGSKLFLRAGAGYSLHPQLAFACQMLQEKDFTIGVYADAGGYLGKYWTQGGAKPFPGHDLSGRVGLNGQRLLPKVRLSYEMAYDGIFAGNKDALDYRTTFHSAYAMGRVQSQDRPGNQLFYDFDLRFRYSGESYTPEMELDNIGESNLRVAVSTGPSLQQKYKILIDGVFEMATIRLIDDMFGGGPATTNLATIFPHLDFLLGPVHLDAGVRLDFSAVGEERNVTFTIAPDVKARLTLAESGLELFAGVRGGQHMEDHYTLKQINHFAPRARFAASISREKLRVRAGLEGHWRSRLQYSLEAGWMSLSGAPLPYYNSLGFADYSSIYALATGAWKSERLELDGRVRYNGFKLTSFTSSFFAPPTFMADIRGAYNWDRRVYVGAFAEAASARTRQSFTADFYQIPGYVNLGLTGEYHFNEKLAFWLEGGNLLGMAIQRTPGCVEKGPYFTLGLQLKL